MRILRRNCRYVQFLLKFVFSKKATKFDEIFIVDLTLTTYCQIDGEDFFNFYGLLRKHELYCYKKGGHEPVVPPALDF